MSLSNHEYKEDKAPQKIVLYHVGQVHMPDARLSKLSTKQEFVEEVSFSQFNIAKTIIVNPKAIVLDEGLTKDITREDFSFRLFSGNDYFTIEDVQKIKDAFPNQFPSAYHDLTIQQKKILTSYRAPLILFSIGIIDAVFKTDTRDEVAKMVKELRKFTNQLRFVAGELIPFFYNPFTDNAEINKIVTDRREKAAINYAIEAARKSGQVNPVVLINYGLGHDYEKKIKEVVNSPEIIYGGRIATIVQQNFSNSIDKILPPGILLRGDLQNAIPKEKVREIVNKYRNVYSSTSLFKSGFRSAAMKALDIFINNFEGETISFKDILVLLSKKDKPRALIFITGENQPKKNIFATDRVIMDLHRAFTELNNLAEEKLNLPNQIKPTPI